MSGEHSAERCCLLADETTASFTMKVRRLVRCCLCITGAQSKDVRALEREDDSYSKKKDQLGDGPYAPLSSCEALGILQIELLVFLL